MTNEPTAQQMLDAKRNKAQAQQQEERKDALFLLHQVAAYTTRLYAIRRTVVGYTIMAFDPHHEQPVFLSWSIGLLTHHKVVQKETAHDYLLIPWYSSPTTSLESLMQHIKEETGITFTIEEL